MSYVYRGKGPFDARDSKGRTPTEADRARSRRTQSRDMNREHGKILFASKAGEYLGLAASSVTAMAVRGELPYVTTQGGHRRYKLTDVLDLAEARLNHPNAQVRERQMRTNRRRAALAAQKKDLEERMERLMEANERRDRGEV